MHGKMIVTPYTPTPKPHSTPIKSISTPQPPPQTRPNPPAMKKSSNVSCAACTAWEATISPIPMSICSVDTGWVLLPSPLKMDEMPTSPMPTWGLGLGVRERGDGS